jgi:LuxR family maltose regulon positive regulatory protein
MATSAERDLLLATKLHIPGPHPGLVPRRRLTGRLDEGLARGVILACAPAGYGKTVLLADWARGSGRPVAWLSLDPGDNDPARFWRHAVAALDGACPGIGARVAPLLGPPAPSSFGGLVAALINDLTGADAVLVLDDYHVTSSDQVRESLAFLIEHRPAGLCVALASRSDPPLALARLRARGELTEIREAGLRVHPRRGRRVAPARPPGCVGGGAGGPDRGLGGRAAAGRAVPARTRRHRRLRGRV